MQVRTWGLVAWHWTRPKSTSTNSVNIWFGTSCDPPPQPAAYANPAGVGALTDGEVSAGKVYLMEWSPGNPITVLAGRSLRPSTSTGNARGASAVVGLKVGDVLQGSAYPGEELVATTLSGEIIIYNAFSLMEIWRTHVTGAAGMFNSILVEDLNHDGVNELYVGGSWGIWRFHQ